jgi:hypothetical protein
MSSFVNADTEASQTPQEPSGYEKARSVANSLSGGNQAPQSNIEGEDEIPFD